MSEYWKGFLVGLLSGGGIVGIAAFIYYLWFMFKFTFRG